MLRLYNTKKYRVIPKERGSYDKAMEFVVPHGLEVYDPETHWLEERFPWDLKNFESPAELHAFLAEYLGFEPVPEFPYPFSFDWARDVPEEVLAAFPKAA